MREEREGYKGSGRDRKWGRKRGEGMGVDISVGQKFKVVKRSEAFRVFAVFQ